MSNGLTLGEEALRHRLAEAPERMIPHIRMGFRMLARLNDQNRENLISFIVQSISKNFEIDTKKAAKLCELDDNTIHDPLTAASFVIGTTSDLDVSADFFMEASADKFFEDADRPFAKQMIDEIFSAKQELDEAIKRSSLANAVLPSLRSMTYKIDIRAKFDDSDKIELLVPVAVFSLSTDSGDDVWFQAPIEKVEWLIEKLERAVKEIKISSEFISGKTQ